MNSHFVSNQHVTYADVLIRVQDCDLDLSPVAPDSCMLRCAWHCHSPCIIKTIQAAYLVSYRQHFHQTTFLSCCKSLHNVMQAAKVQSNRTVERRLQQAIADSTAIEAEKDAALVCTTPLPPSHLLTRSPPPYTSNTPSSFPAPHVPNSLFPPLPTKTHLFAPPPLIVFMCTMLMVSAPVITACLCTLNCAAL